MKSIWARKNTVWLCVALAWISLSPAAWAQEYSSDAIHYGFYFDAPRFLSEQELIDALATVAIAQSGGGYIPECGFNNIELFGWFNLTENWIHYPSYGLTDEKEIIIRWYEALDNGGNCAQPRSSTVVSLFRHHDVPSNPGFGFALEPTPQACPIVSNNASNPCDPANGNKSQVEVDYVSTANGGLSFSRFYNSKGSYKTADAMAPGWRHTYSRVLDEEPDITPALKFASSSNQSAAYTTAAAACTSGWGDIKASVWLGDLSSATATFSGGNVCKIEVGSVVKAYFPVRSGSGFGGYTPPATIKTVTRANGASAKFELVNSNWINQLDPSLTLEQSGSNWIFTDTNDTKDTFNSQGQLISVTTRSGRTGTLVYNLTAAQGGDDDSDTLDRVTGPFGHTLTFDYDGSGRLDSVTTPDGTLQYAYVSGNLSSVMYPDNTVRQYVYENTNYTNHLTGIIDENDDRFATWAYDGEGRAILSEHAGGKEQVTFVYNASGTTTLTMGNGATRDYVYSTEQGSRKLTMMTGDVCSTCPGGEIADRTFDANGFLDEVFDWEGNVTQTVRNSRGLTETLIEARGSAVQRTTTTIWETNFRLPKTITSPKNVTNFVYDANGNPTSITISSGALTRSWGFTYNSSGQPLTINGPRIDVNDTTILDYYECTTGDECGQLESATNALSQTTTYDAYDGSGRLTQMTDPNGLELSFSYDTRGNLRTVTQTPVAGVARVTTMTYDNVNQLETVATPDGMILTYSYDAAHYLRSVSDNLGNRIDYDYDSMGNLEDEDTYDPSSTLKRAVDYVHDLNDRLDTVNNGGFITDLTLDLVGNLTNETDPASAQTQHAYDALNRLDQSIDALTGVIDYEYDDHDNLTSVTAANGAQTIYAYDELDNLTEEISPDRGTTMYTYDDAGNRISQLDARGKTTTYEFDALNRLTLTTFNDASTIQYAYDAGANAIGRLSTIADSSGSTTWNYDNFGAVTQKVQVIGTVLLTIGYGYDDDGRMISMTYPSGKVVTFGYNSYQVDSVAVDGETTLVGATYEPFGPVNAWTWGNGTPSNRDFDLRGLITSHSIGTDTRTLGYDPAGQLTSMQDTRNDVTYDYDLLGRLTDAVPTNGTGGAGPLFTGTPVLLASIQTMKNEIAVLPMEASTPWLTVATKNVTASGAKLALERGQVNTGTIGVKEKIGYVAIEAVSGGSFIDSGGNTITYEAQTTPEFIQGWGTGCFETAFQNTYATKPVVMAALNTHRGGDGGWLRRCSLNKSTLGLTVDEDKFGDAERKHNNAESAGLVAFSAAFDAQFTDVGGTWGMEMAKVTLPSTVTTPQFTSIAFRQAYASKPVVIVLPNKSGSNPASVRIRNVSKTGFEVVQVEPAPENGTHKSMPIHYLAIEPGTHSLPDGTKLEVGRKATKKQQHGAGLTDSEGWASISFGDQTQALPLQVFDYDPNGNRTTLTEDGTPYSYSNLINSNRVLSAAGPVAKTFTYDAAGNITGDGVHTYVYDDRSRFVDVDSGAATYQHNGQGQRVTKNGGTLTLFAYDEAGQLIGEYDSLGNAVHEHVWLGGAPVAVLQGADKHYVHTDHLGTPRAITDGNTVIWRWESDPFGTTSAQEDPDGDSTLFTYNLRFPGQYYDGETGFHYNYYRTFDPSTGRYLESDPIGLRAELNTYAYVGGNPLFWVDPLGLDVQVCSAPADIASGLVNHQWIKTDSQEAGMGGDVQNPGQEYESLFVTKVKVTDHSGQSETREGASCEVVEADEDKVNQQLQIGKPLGRFSPTNNCQTFVNQVLKNAPTLEQKQRAEAIQSAVRNLNRLQGD